MVNCPQTAMSDDAPAESSRSSHSWTYWSLWACLIALIIYPLSTGPVLLLAAQGTIPYPVMDIYAPLEVLYNNSETAERFFD